MTCDYNDVIKALPFAIMNNMSCAKSRTLSSIEKLETVLQLSVYLLREAVDAAKDVISKLKLKKFVPVENGAVQSCFRMVEAHALLHTTMEKVFDETLPDLDRMRKKLGSRSATFTSQVYPEASNT